MSVKKRNYSEEYLPYGFTEVIVHGEAVPQCVICFEFLSNDDVNQLAYNVIFKQITFVKIANSPAMPFSNKSLLLSK